MLPDSTQQNTINDFVENIILKSNFYGLAVDSLTNENRTLVTAIPYPSTSQYNVRGYGSARSVSDFKNQVIAFNTVIKPIAATSDISDALLYVSDDLPSGGVISSLIIVGNSAAMIDQSAAFMAEILRSDFAIYTVSVGDNPVDLSSLSSGAKYSFTGNTKTIADKIGLNMATSNPSLYCPPPIIPTSAPTTTIKTDSLTTATTTPPLCKNPYNGKIATVFELNAVQAEILDVVTFVSKNLYNSVNYDFTGPTQAINIPYGDTDNQDYQSILNYGDAKSLTDLQTNIDTLFYNAVITTNPEVSDGIQWLADNRDPAGTTGVTVVVGTHDDSNYGLTVGSLMSLRGQGWKVITVYLGVNSTYFDQIADKPEWYFQVDDSNGQYVANQISYIVCNL